MLSKSRIINLRHYLTFIYNYSLGSNVKHLRCVTKNFNASYSQDTHYAEKWNINDIIPANKYVQRSHTCGELSTRDIGETVHLCGWMEYQRMGKFLTLRDSYGSTQLIIPDENLSLIEFVETLNYETVLSVTGKVTPRPLGQENTKMETGSIEVQVDHLEVLNYGPPNAPFHIRDHNVPKESLQMKYRYLTLRFPWMQRNLRIRSTLIHKMREFLINECDFVDVETPTLFRRTPGGAQEFVVPTQNSGKFYSLVQSPQQFKQLLMVGGIDRYFQIARCYRDESARPDRQPEFTQLDIEMSFVDCEGIMNLIEDLLAHSWPKEMARLMTPFRRYTYEQVMETYGSDQPDLRIPYHISNITELITNGDKNTSVYALSIPNAMEFLTTSVRNQFNEMREMNFKSVKLIQTKVTGDWQTKIAKIPINTDDLMEKYNISTNDAVFIAWSDKTDKNAARKLIGKIRTEFTDLIEMKGHKIRTCGYEFLWVTDFPLFEKGENGELLSTHHPFTAVHPEDMKYIPNDPLRARGLHYDLVLNGSEIAGGSIRIHDAKVQQQILDLLNINDSQLKHLLEALASGAPPHGGIAFGMDRLISIICQSPSIRSVIAFPKSMEGRDLMSGAPAEISEEEKKLYHLK